MTDLGLNFGVSKVYSQQCGYVLSDAESVGSNVKTAMKSWTSVKTTTSKGHVARKEQITLQDDMNFNLDVHFDLNAAFDLPELDLDTLLTAPLHNSNLFSIGQSSQSPNPDDLSTPGRGLEISSDNGFSPGLALGFGDRASSVSSNNAVDRSRLYQGRQHNSDLDPPGLMDDVGLFIDSDGNIGEVDINSVHAQGDGNGLYRHSSLPEDIRLTAKQKIDANAYEVPALDDDIVMYDEAQPFSPRRGNTEVQDDEDEDGLVEDEPQDATAAQRTTTQKIKTLVLDTIMEFRNTTINDNDRNYAQNRLHESVIKEHRRQQHHAHNNITAWFQDTACVISSLFVPQPLQMFNGSALIIDPAVLSPSVAAKRPRAADNKDDDSESDRSKKRRAESNSERDLNRQALAFDGDDAPLFADDTLEVGRAGETPMQGNRSSVAPQAVNIRSSVFGSSAHSRQPLNIGGIRSSSVDMQGDFVPCGGSISVDASPLRNHGGPIESAADLGDDEQDAMQLDDNGMPVDVSQSFGAPNLPSWFGNSQTADPDSFFDFLKNSVSTKAREIRSSDGNESDTERDSAGVALDFSELIEPQANARWVATAAFTSLLTLATKSLVNVEQVQSHAFMPLSISVAA